MFTRGIQLKAMRSFILILFLSNLSLHASYMISGTITYHKDVYSSPTDFTTENVAAEGILIEASNGIDTVSDFTNNNGAYSLTLTGSNYTLTVKSQTNDVHVVPTQGSSQVYGKDIASAINSVGTFNFLVEKNHGSGAINIAIQVQKGVTFFKTAGHELTLGSGAEVVYGPGATSTQYDPGTDTIYIGSPQGDPDEFDDDVILHEFGHLAMDLMSKDDSNGGDHLFNSGQYRGEDLDLRLAYSEGVATWIACAVVNKNSYMDFGAGIRYTIPGVINAQDSEKSSQGPSTTTSEWAVNYLIYQASLAHANNGPVLQTLANMKNSQEVATMDSFWDEWQGSSLVEYSADVGMGYFEDGSEPNSSESPRQLQLVEGQTFARENLTFYSSSGVSDTDTFTFTPIAGQNYTVSTNNANNGALTSIKIYKGSASPSQLIGENNQANGSQTDNTSRLVFQADDTTDIVIAVSRFNSDTAHYGPGQNNAYIYKSTAGKYGKYDLYITHGGQISSNATNGNSGLDSISPTTQQNSSSGGGGGCLLK